MADGSIDYNVDKLRPFDKERQEDPIIDVIRRIIDTGGGDKEADIELRSRNSEVDARKSSEENDSQPVEPVEPVEPQKDSSNLFKVDGRTKEYRDTVSRISTGSKRKGDGLDGRSKGYKSTMKRISARRSKMVEKDNEEI